MESNNKWPTQSPAKSPSKKRTMSAQLHLLDDTNTRNHVLPNVIFNQNAHFARSICKCFSTEDFFSCKLAWLFWIITLVKLKSQRNKMHPTSWRVNHIVFCYTVLARAGSCWHLQARAAGCSLQFTLLSMVLLLRGNFWMLNIWPLKRKIHWCQRGICCNCRQTSELWQWNYNSGLIVNGLFLISFWYIFKK